MTTKMINWVSSLRRCTCDEFDTSNDVTPYNRHDAVCVRDGVLPESEDNYALFERETPDGKYRVFGGWAGASYLIDRTDVAAWDRPQDNLLESWYKMSDDTFWCDESLGGFSLQELADEGFWIYKIPAGYLLYPSFNAFDWHDHLLSQEMEQL